MYHEQRGLIYSRSRSAGDVSLVFYLTLPVKLERSPGGYRSTGHQPQDERRGRWKVETRRTHSGLAYHVFPRWQGGRSGGLAVGHLPPVRHHSRKSCNKGEVQKRRGASQPQRPLTKSLTGKCFQIQQLLLFSPILAVTPPYSSLQGISFILFTLLRPPC